MIIEIAVAVADRGPGRVQAGDIVGARLPTGIVGDLERTSLLWMQIDSDLTPAELESYEAPKGTEDRTVHSTAPGQGKRRYNIPLATLVSARGLDKGRIKDTGNNYQPLLGVTVLAKDPQLDKRNPTEKTAIDTWRTAW